MSRTTTVTTVPVLQVAADGQWETAETMPVAGDPAAARIAIEQAARTARNDVAVEILWPGQAFVGVQWPAASWRQAAAGASRGFVVLADDSPAPPSQPVVAAKSALLRRPDLATCSHPLAIELGVRNPQPCWIGI